MLHRFVVIGERKTVSLFKRSLRCMGTMRSIDAPLTKLVSTIGPSSEEYEPLSKCVAAGMSTMRLNFSHATREEFDLRMSNLSKVPGGEYVARMLDTRGPEIRMGGLAICAENRKAKLELNEDAELILTTDTKIDGHGNANLMYVNYSKLCTKVKPGDQILLDDGAIVVQVESVGEFEVKTRIMNGGLLGERKGVNLPGIPLELPAMSEKDKADIQLCVEHGIDLIAASFVHDAAGVLEIMDFVTKTARKYPEQYPNFERPWIIPKIESLEAIRNLDEIIAVSDGIMVARGDLGVEVPLVQVVQYQKDIVAKCRAMATPVIVATQMLDSMSANPRPTRAEVADVTNAVLESADGVMLSGETAAGKYPDLVISTQRDICKTSEVWHSKNTMTDAKFPLAKTTSSDNEYALAAAALAAQRATKASAIIALIDHPEGILAKQLAAGLPDVPVIALVSSPRLARQLSGLFRGVFPLILPDLCDISDEATAVDIVRRAFVGFEPNPTLVTLLQNRVSLQQ
mmetsp:Transcript_16025/g.24043  ORF Transcript_16025/g.24043 Transcript_16025/m.24043 type:complete len:515 (+) Transcript_16025:43-1587(+)